jgi:hypothetical protein
MSITDEELRAARSKPKEDVPFEMVINRNLIKVNDTHTQLIEI